MLAAHTSIQTQLLVGTTVLVFVALYAWSKKPKGKLPPGPKGLPLLGNVLQVPREHLATYFRVLHKQYGGMFSLNLLGNTMIVVGDGALARELMDKRSGKYSGRPMEPYMKKYVDPDEKYWGFCDPGATFRTGRKLTTQVMTAVRAGRSHGLQRYEAMLTLQDFIEKPDGWYHHIDRYAVSAIISAMFGVQFKTGNEQTMKDIIELNDQFGLSISNAASIINVFPFLDWIPGPMPWRKNGAAYREREETIYANLAREAIEGSNSGLENWAQYFAGKDNKLGDNRELLNLFAIAAAHSTATGLQSFVLACMCHPEWIKKAQAQIDAVVGSNRLPDFSDRESLPYMEAVIRETLRWRPAARFGIPHKTTEDDIVQYNGEEYFIPKDTTIVGVPWIIEHDPAVYPDPDVFRPERWLNEKGELIAEHNTSAFGWGRRTCPGSPFAERSLWINLTNWLWAFNPKRVPGYQYTSEDSAFLPDFGTAPKQFPVDWEPRSAQHIAVAKREWLESEKDLRVLMPVKSAQ